MDETIIQLEVKLMTEEERRATDLMHKVGVWPKHHDLATIDTYKFTTVTKVNQDYIDGLIDTLKNKMLQRGSVLEVVSVDTFKQVNL